MTLYMMTTRDKYELPLAVAESPGELAQMVGVSPERVYNGCWQSTTARSRGKRPRKWHKVEVEDDDALC